MKGKCLSIGIVLYLTLTRLMANPTHTEVIVRDMSRSQPVRFDHWVEDVSCTVLRSDLFPDCISLIDYKGRYYIMGRDIAGVKVVIFNHAGALEKELRFNDALLVNSMTIVPRLDELWVVSSFQIINKFKPDGTPLGRIKLPFACASIAPVGTSGFLVYSGGGTGRQANIEGHFAALTDFKSIQRLFLPKWGTQKRPYAPYSLYAYDHNPEYTYMFPDCVDTIYRYSSSDKRLIPYYALDFHGDFLTKDKVPFGPTEDQRMSEIITQKQYIYIHTSFHCASGRLFFLLHGKHEGYRAIDLKDHSLYAFDGLLDGYRPDSFNPIIGAGANCLYVIVRGQALKKHYQSVPCSYPRLKEILSALPEKEDPWILLTINIKR